jgi:UrcA family protein
MFSFRSDALHVVPAALAAALIISFIQPADAAALHPQANSTIIRFRSSDLDTPQDVARLYRRIRLAAQSVCGQPDDAFVLERLMWEQCVDQAIATAVAKVNSGSLSAYRDRQRNPRKRPPLQVPDSVVLPEVAAR